MNRAKRSSAISILLIAVLVFTAVFNVAITSTLHIAGNSPATDNVAAASNGLKKSDMNLDSVKEQYLNHQTVEANTASFDGRRWVIAELEGESLFDAFKSTSRFGDFSEFTKSIEGKKVLASIKAQQSRFLNKLDKYGVDYTFKYSYSALSTGVAIQVDASGYNTIAAMSGVKGVYYSESYAVPKFEAVGNNANVYPTGIYDTDDLVNIDLDGDGQPDGTFQGQGMAVAILDTGLDYTHEAFDPVKYREDLDEVDGNVRYTKEAIGALLNDEDFKAEQFGAGLNDVYYNEKVPFAYDYADDDAMVFPGYSNHGTHVAGIVAGKSDFDVTPDDKTDDETFRGVAPLAQLVICKVFTDDLFSDTLGGGNDIDILAALEDCARLGVDVINMSLGTSAGFSDEQSEIRHIEIYNHIRELGISLVCAASNDYSSGFGGGNGTNLSTNPDSGTVGSPSTYFAALSVASINGQKSKYIQGNNDSDQVAFITNASDGDGNRLEFIEELRKQLAAKYGDANKDLRGGDVFTKGTSGDIVLKYVLVGGVGRPNNYSSSVSSQLKRRTLSDGTKVDGTVALIKRGDTTFAEKVQEAMSNGADAVIIYNNVSGTINMSLGEVNDPVPTCLITMDASAPFVDYAKNHSSVGTIQVSDSFEAGPFMSDFSSWGPVSDLTLKPEITAHGGEITSAVPGAYDVLSGTSMASPNMAGAVAVLRQYIQETSESKGAPLTGNELNARVNQVLMSTATIARNEEGNPYSPRKQGAGLAGITDAVLSEGYITVSPYGNAAKVYTENNESTKNCIVEGCLDKTKIELFDDPQRTGIYELRFTVHNITDVPQIYAPTTYVMTETLASDKRTVAEKAYMLTDMCEITYSGEGVAADNTITVPKKGSVTVTVTVKLGDKAREYFAQKVTRQIVGTDGRPKSVTTEPFKNGMYVEGFVSLDNITNGDREDAKGVTLGVPYLAFYGDWTDAPLFDYDIYEVSESEGNSAIDFENKLKATSLPSQVIGRYHNDDYILPLGTYLYEMDEEEDDIYPSRDKIALSQYDEEGSYTVYELYAAYAGLLRNASEVKTVVTNAKTGEIVYEETLQNVGKAYAAGGGNRGAFVRYEINPSEWGWQNNDEFYFKIEGWLDYGKDGKPIDYTNSEPNPAQSTAKDDEPQTAWEGVRNTFEFPLTIDYEAPQILDYKIRFDSYKENNVIKYRTYLDLSVYDNQYVMSVLPCYLKEEKEGKVGTYLNLLTEYPIPVYGDKGGTTKVSIDISDYYEKYLVNQDLDNDIGLFIQVEDYAMNAEVYEISLSEESLTYPTDTVTFVSDSKLKDTGKTGINKGLDGSDNSDVIPDVVYHKYELNDVNPFELYKLNVPSSREKEFITQNLHWEGETELVKANGNEIYVLGTGAPATLKLVGTQNRYLGNTQGWRETDVIYAEITVNPGTGKPGRMPNASGLSIKPIHCGDNYVVNLDNISTGSVEVHPNDDITLEAEVSPWYFQAAYEYSHKDQGQKFEFVWTSNKPEIAEFEEGTSKIKFKKRGTVTVTCKAKDTSYPLLVRTVNFSVGEDYYVNNYTLLEWYGGEIVEIPTDVNVLYLDEDCFKNDKTIKEVVLPPLLMEIPNFAFQNCEKLEKITIPSQCAYIGPYAFEGCKNLKTVVFPEYVDANKDPVPGYYGSIAVGHYAFKDCTSLKEFVTDKVGVDGKPEKSHRMTVMYDGAFAGCTALEEIDISELRVAGRRVFAGCTSLSNVTTSAHTAIGPYMFGGYAAGPGRELYCTSLESFEFKGNYLPEGVFYGCSALGEFTFAGEELQGIGAYAFEDTGLTSIKLPAGEYTVGSGAFANCTKLAQVSINAGSTLTFDGLNPFEGCQNLVFKVEGEGESYKLIDGALYNFAGDTLISLPSSVTSYSFPKGVTKIGDSALSGSSLSTIDLTGITSIGKYAFAGSKLTSVVWPESITTIADGTFFDCDELTSVTGIQNVTEVGSNAFASCNNLTNLTFGDKLTEVGIHAFSFLTDLRNAEQNKLRNIYAPNLQTVGAYAFAGTIISGANYSNVTSLGEGAFRQCGSLGTVTLGAVTTMGDFAFYGTLALSTVNFADGTTGIGDYAFSTYDPRVDSLSVQNPSKLSFDDKVLYYVRPTYMNIKTRTALTTINVGGTGSLKNIGEFAFAGQAGLTTIDLSGVQTVGNSAFRRCGGLGTANLKNVETIGDYAFFGTSLTAVELDNATVIGDYAFAGGQQMVFDNTDPVLSNVVTREISGGLIATLTMPKVERIGAFAFAGNKLRTVNIPATMNKRTYTYEEKLYDDEGRYERSRTRIANTFGAGVFAYNKSLTNITVAEGNPAFTSKDGVLYAYVTVETGKTANGDPIVENDKMELVQYPGGRTARKGKYTVEDKTIAIGASAFEGASGRSVINAIEFPYTVKVIGSSAFYATEIMDYTFNSVQAPTIVAANDSTAVEIASGIFAYSYNRQLGHYPWAIDPETDDIYLDIANITISAVYSNFVDYVYLSGFGNAYFALSADGFLGIKFNVPSNGVGYDNQIFTYYADEIKTTGKAMDDISYEAAEKLNELESFTIEDIAKETDLVNGELAKAVKAAREAYNLVNGDDQRELLKAQYEKLLEFEAALRQAKKDNADSSDDVTLVTVECVTPPQNFDYTVGDALDPKGIVIQIVYSDGSELRITWENFGDNVKLENTIATKNENMVLLYTDAFTGEQKRIEVPINVREPFNPGGPSGGDDPQNPGEIATNVGGLPTWAIALIAVIAVLAVAAAVTATLIALKKKGKFAPKAKKSAEPKQEPAQEPLNEEYPQEKDALDLEEESGNSDEEPTSPSDGE